MQVVTLNPKDFEVHAKRLAETVEKCSATHYDAIVAVRRGGSYVCDAFLRYFPKTRYVERYDLTLQRPTTKNKERHLGKLLRHLPYPLLDAMRKAESLLLTKRRKTKEAPEMPETEVPGGLRTTLTLTRQPEILVIDDAIDSGDTLFAIVETLRNMNPAARISIAVMTETTCSPRIRATHTLYRNRTLIRFPWSNDYKNP